MRSPLIAVIDCIAFFKIRIMNFISENKGVITVESGKHIIEFSVEDFARFFNKRNISEYWQFPTKWKREQYSTVVSGLFIHYPGTETLEDFIRERRHQCKIKTPGKNRDTDITNQLNLSL